MSHQVELVTEQKTYRITNGSGNNCYTLISTYDEEYGDEEVVVLKNGEKVSDKVQRKVIDIAREHITNRSDL